MSVPLALTVTSFLVLPMGIMTYTAAVWNPCWHEDFLQPPVLPNRTGKKLGTIRQPLQGAVCCHCVSPALTPNLPSRLRRNSDCSGAVPLLPPMTLP